MHCIRAADFACGAVSNQGFGCCGLAASYAADTLGSGAGAGAGHRARDPFAPHVLSPDRTKCPLPCLVAPANNYCASIWPPQVD
ncbi:hypothetical protein GUJ93_ZPchr0004g39440 [Zizania palustris]|uniref:Uncharacterized protein n=1 Tax=Zizania palustris TaxID=103762 RepID=A0A8J5SR87_ZIZPA|nr:hypothetical protein GUJ93_ZPchr0004g39440 [Zizania palustris]